MEQTYLSSTAAGALVNLLAPFISTYRTFLTRKTQNVTTKLNEVGLVTERTTVLHHLTPSRLRYEWPDSHRRPHNNLFTLPDSGELQIVVRSEFPQR